jgi:hypothetical protein
MYTEKRMGLSTDPRGTPEEQFRVNDAEFQRRTVCDRPTMFEKSHSKAVPDTPKLADNLDSRRLYKMVSNTALQSRETSLVGRPDSTVV